jgi:hypothetical protein
MRTSATFARVRVDYFNKGFGDLGASGFGEAELAAEGVDHVGFGRVGMGGLLSRLQRGYH